MNSPVVSLGVCITYHNERELLTENLNSLTDLLPGVDKVYVYDDASQYPARDWIPAGMQVEVVRGESNIGPGRARNVLWRQCDADYIHFHDADDIFLPGWAQRVRAEIQRTGFDAVLTETNAFRDGKTVGERGFDLAGVRNNDDLLDYAIRRSMLTLTGTWKRQLLETTGGYDEGLWQSEDYDLNIRLVALRPSFSIILDPLVSIRIHAGNRSRLHVEVYRDAVLAIEKLAPALGAPWAKAFAEKTTHSAQMLFAGGDIEGAEQAFRLAAKLGGPRYVNNAGAYALLARILGPLNAERVAAMYRRVPLALRLVFHRRSE